MTAAVTLHAGCVVIGEQGVLIRGPSGSGKSRLALSLMEQARLRSRFFALVSDDRTGLTRFEGQNGPRLIARPHPLTVGLIERRGTGLVTGPHLLAARLHLVIDLTTEPPQRLPDPDTRQTLLLDVPLMRISCLRGDPDPAFAALGLDLWGETVIT